VKRTTRFVIGAVVIVVVGAIGVGTWWLLREDAPAEVSLQVATESVAPTTTGAGSTTPAGIDGRWVVDADSGTFDYESATGSFVGFRIDEELVGIGAIEAVGRTGEVTGELAVDGDELTAASFTADLTSITTNDRRRDDKALTALEVGTFPQAAFTLTAPVSLGAGAPAGEPVRATVTGEFTLHGVTRTVEVPVEAQLVDGVVVVVGSFRVLLADYGLEVPTAPIVVSASDSATIEFQLLFGRA